MRILRFAKGLDLDNWSKKITAKLIPANLVLEKVNRNKFMRPPGNLTTFIWYFLKQHPWKLVVIIFTSLIWAAELSLSPYFFKMIIDGVSNYGTQAKPLLSVILVPACFYISMSLLLNASFRLYDWVNIHLQIKLYTKITAVVYDYTVAHSYNFFKENFAGSIADKVLYLPRDIDGLLKSINNNFMPKIFAIFIAVVGLYFVQPALSIILLTWVILFVGITIYFSSQCTENSRQFHSSLNKLNGAVVDSITNVLTVKIFSRANYEKCRVLQSHEEVNQRYKVMHFYNMKLHTVQGLAVTLLVSAMLFALVTLRLHEQVSIGDFVFVLSLSTAMIIHVWDLGTELILFTRNAGKCQHALSLITEPHEITEAKDAQVLQISKGKINFEKVSFAHNQRKAIFDQLSVTIPPGQKVGLVGFSGGGKSTFVNLILRLFDLNSGAITIDGQDIKQVTLASLRENIGFIPQEPELFHRSVMENIAYGRLNATEEEVITASKKAHCHEFIQELEGGYSALVGERGIKLSGGQRQRIAIARAILKQAPILILDEATSALDSITEKYIQESLHYTMQGKTTIVIAHRLSTLLEMDRILFFKEGQIIEDGTLEELKSNQGPFAKLWEMQSDGFLPI